MKVKEFLEVAGNLSKSNLFDEILEHDVNIQLHNSAGIYLGNSFKLDYAGYKFSPWHENSDGTKGSLTLDITIVDKER